MCGGDSMIVVFWYASLLADWIVSAERRLMFVSSDGDVCNTGRDRIYVLGLFVEPINILLSA